MLSGRPWGKASTPGLIPTNAICRTGRVCVGGFDGGAGRWVLDARCSEQNQDQGGTNRHGSLQCWCVPTMAGSVIGGILSPLKPVGHRAGLPRPVRAGYTLGS